ncbi:MAG: hypothetical protein ACT4PV_00010 [Planctomycetaceae bacterium]
MKIDFYRDTDGAPMARASHADWQALSGLLTSDIDSIDGATEVLGMLRRAAESGTLVDGTGNAYTVQAKGPAASVEFAIDESIRPVRLPTRELIALIEAWLGFLRRGAPRVWPGTDAGSRDVLCPPQ